VEIRASSLDYFGPMVSGERSKRRAFGSRPTRKLVAARISASLSLRVITKIIMVRKIPHLAASCWEALPHLEFVSFAVALASGTGAVDGCG